MSSHTACTHVLTHPVRHMFGTLKGHRRIQTTSRRQQRLFGRSEKNHPRQRVKNAILHGNKNLSAFALKIYNLAIIVYQITDFCSRL